MSIDLTAPYPLVLKFKDSRTPTRRLLHALPSQLPEPAIRGSVPRRPSQQRRISTVPE